MAEPIPNPLPRAVIRTHRLELRVVAPTDAADVVESCNDPAVFDNTARIPSPYTRADADAFVQRVAQSIEQGDEICFASRRRDNKAFVGTVGLAVDRDHAKAEIGYLVAAAQRGNGFATEQGAAVTTFGFERLNLHRIFAGWYQDNPPSGRVLEKLGYQQEGVLREDRYRGNRFRSSVQTAILAREFTDIKASNEQYRAIEID